MQPGQGGNTQHVFIRCLIEKKSNANIRLTQREEKYLNPKIPKFFNIRFNVYNFLHS